MQQPLKHTHIGAMSTPTTSKNAPKDLKFDDIITTVQCHPTQNLIASGLIGGDVYIHSYSTEKENVQVHQLVHHKKACRALKFSEDGRRLFSVSKDKSLYCVDVETGRLKKKIKNAHRSPIYSLAITGETFIATGDDDGLLKVWDMRSKTASMELKECDDFISDMIVEDNKKTIIASSGEGTLTSFNIRQKRMESQSELFDSELLCLAKMKSGRKLICGTGEGVLNIFNWGQWGNISDRFPCGNSEIDSMIAVTDDVLCIGTNDGSIKAVHILANRILGQVGQHDDEFPVEAMSLSSDTMHIASCSHDQLVKFWNVDSLKSQTVDTSRRATKQARKHVTVKGNDFFSGLLEENNHCEDVSDKDDDSD
uniref:Uncharacterized protein n=1 Tax=Arion vulgaris TaxID=1028688 RepID=A0A0B6ZZW1_9EUPU